MKHILSAPKKVTRRSAFSLVELMVVIGIIALLAGIAMPAFSAARIGVKKATTKAAIGTIDTGINMFRADEKFGGTYPPSYYFGPTTIGNPYGIPPAKFDIGGAGLAVWALAGADLLGTAGFKDLNHTDLTGGVAPWADDIANLYGVTGIIPNVPRSSFVDSTKMRFAQRKVGLDGYVYFEIPAGKVPSRAPCFLDAFDQPILYYKANVGRPQFACNMPMSDFSNPANAGSTGIYNMNDNLLNLTTQNYGAGNGHFQGGALGALNNINIGPEPRGSFAWTIYNPSATVWTPYNPDSYILLSAGPDGIFGTPDDIANYEMNK